jgi:hypothetical protein
MQQQKSREVEKAKHAKRVDQGRAIQTRASQLMRSQIRSNQSALQQQKNNQLSNTVRQFQNKSAKLNIHKKQSDQPKVQTNREKAKELIERYKDKQQVTSQKKSDPMPPQKQSDQPKVQTNREKAKELIERYKDKQQVTSQKKTDPTPPQKQSDQPKVQTNREKAKELIERYKDKQQVTSQKKSDPTPPQAKTNQTKLAQHVTHASSGQQKAKGSQLQANSGKGLTNSASKIDNKVKAQKLINDNKVSAIFGKNSTKKAALTTGTKKNNEATVSKMVTRSAQKDGKLINNKVPAIPGKNNTKKTELTTNTKKNNEVTVSKMVTRSSAQKNVGLLPLFNASKSNLTKGSLSTKQHSTMASEKNAAGHGGGGDGSGSDGEGSGSDEGEGIELTPHSEENNASGSKEASENLVTHYWARNRVQHEAFKENLREKMQKPFVKDKKLQNFIDEVYKEHDKMIGNGSTAAAIRRERKTGEKVFGRLHTKKGKDALIYFGRWLNDNPTACPGDRAAVENIVKDLKDSLGLTQRLKLRNL